MRGDTTTIIIRSEGGILEISMLSRGIGTSSIERWPGFA
jgi:hypothetical protein